MNADPVVMEHFPSVLTPQESDGLVAKVERHFERHGFGFWAVEIPNVTPFAGFVGLLVPPFDAPFTPCVEIGWRFAHAHWGQAYATEAARAAMASGFDTLALKEIVSFTSTGNTRSRRVMEQLNMAHNPADDFDHPMMPAGHPLSRHVLYRRSTAA
jgi:RimJ/RimL family protein N-acetyltransferase